MEDNSSVSASSALLSLKFTYEISRIVFFLQK